VARRVFKEEAGGCSSGSATRRTTTGSVVLRHVVHSRASSYSENLIQDVSSGLGCHVVEGYSLPGMLLFTRRDLYIAGSGDLTRGYICREPAAYSTISGGRH
jgi:hypothetical protein